MKKHLSLLSILCFISISFIQSQTITEKPDWHFFSKALIPEPTPDLPDWIKPLYSTSVNISAVEAAMLEHYTAKGGFKRDTYSRFFQRWADAATPYMDKNGNISNWNTPELLANQNQAKTSPKSTTKSAGNWTFLGPDETYWRADDANSGPANWQVNVYSFDIAPSNPNILYAGTETGGLFKTVDKGLNWTFIAQDYNFGGAIQAVSVHPSDANTAYVATSTTIFKTTDGGTTWTILYTQSGLACTDLEVHPSDPTRIFASTELGLLRSDNAGTSWNLILTEEFYDIVFQVGNPSTVYALGHDVGTGLFVLYKSTNGGIGFSQSMSGWGSVYERSGGKLAVSAANPNYVYAILLTDDNAGGNEKPYLQKSTDGGTTWTTIATGTTTAFPMNNGQGYYDLSILVSATNAEELIIGTQIIYRSTDGGTSFSTLTNFGSTPISIHPDMQASKCAGGDCWIATDGGMSYSTDFFSNPSNYAIRNKGISGSDFWGYTQGWNQDMFVGGRYHNGNTAWHENYPIGQALRMGGAESATGWILYGRERKAYFDDIGGYTIPMAITDAPTQDFAFTKHPNKVYGRTTSRLLNHPENAAIYFTGEANDFWKSTDAGLTWTSLKSFGEKVWWFEMSRSNPNVIYVITNSGFHKTTDGGLTWSNMTAQLPAGFGYYSRGRVTVDGRDENSLWLLRYNGGNGAKVYKSIDGGATWINWTTATLDGRNFSCLVHALGTNGGVYLASINGSANANPAKVYYRNNTDSDWVEYADNLPAGMHPLKVVPFYRDSKIRIAGTLSVWEADLVETSNIIAQPMIANESELKCGQDIQFDCYSVLDHNGASWSWSFPMASTVSSTTARNPVVRYASPGTYMATLTITRGPEMDSKTIAVVVGNGGTCVRGMALDSNTDSDNDGLNDLLESTTCTNSIPQGAAVSGSNVVVGSIDFNNATSGLFYANVTVFTNCYNTTATLRAFVDLDNQAIQVISYDHFDTAPDDISGDGTNILISQSTAYAQIRFELTANSLNIIQVVNACGSFLQLSPSCWSNLDTDGDGQMNLLDTDSDNDGLDDTTESTSCNNAIAQTGTVNGSNTLITTLNFGGASTGLFYVSLNAFTNCYNTTATLNAFVDLDNQTIQVVAYDHFANASDIVLGNNTNAVTSGSNSYATVSFQLMSNQLQIIQVANACGDGAFMRLNASCWSALDSDADGVAEFLEYAPLLLDLKVMLQGAYNATSMDMNTTLHSIVPLSQPYTNLYTGVETVSTIPADVVDWVLVELRQPATTVVSRRAAFIKKDGSIVDLDGSSFLGFNVAAGNYFVAVRHRNHLGVMTENQVLLSD